MHALPKPVLSENFNCGVPYLTDDALFGSTRVRIAFTGRGIVDPENPYSAFNLSLNVGDDEAHVYGAQGVVMSALGAAPMPVITPKQVHGSEIVIVEDEGPGSVEAAQRIAAIGADAVLVELPNVAAMLCFADCVPVIIVSPTGAFCVAHAGWRGVEACIAQKAVLLLAKDLPADMNTSDFNVYIGPHIRECCFEVSEDVHERFTKAFGTECAASEKNISLIRALKASLEEVGICPERIADAEICTVCNSGQWFSYRASGGVCGRHGAIAFRAEDKYEGGML